MKTIISKPTQIAGSLLLSTMLCLSCTMQNERANAEKRELLADPDKTVNKAIAMPVTTSTNKKIKIALLLDTSNSMDGLIDQAKSQLWKLVNELSLASCDSVKPELEIALYEYGNDRLSEGEGYIRQVSAFTTDLDGISEKLFALSTNGGSEFCGQVIQCADNELEWGVDNGDYKVIFIAGNEEFTQGTVSYKKSCALAKERDIYVNTIFCGDYKEGMNTGWLNGANVASGAYMNIDQDEKTVYIETPYDAEIAKLNDKLNNTYVSYGSLGYSKKQNQITQDANAATYGAANTSTRIVSKTTKFYKNDDWDLVDASKQKEFDITKIKDTDLPTELRGKSKEEKQKYIDDKNKEREEIIKQIAELNKKRLAYIAEKEKTMDKKDNSLDAAMLKAIRQQAAKKNFVFEG